LELKRLKWILWSVGDSIKIRVSNVGDARVTVRSVKIVDRSSPTTICYNSNPLLELEPRESGEVVVAGCTLPLSIHIHEVRVTTQSGYEKPSYSR